MKKNFWIVFLVPVLFFSCKKHETFEERCAREARQYTLKQCPMTVQKGLTMDSIAYRGQGNKLIYYYTFSGELDNAEMIQKNSIPFKKKLLDALSTSVDLKAYKDRNISFEYVYSSKSTGKPILDYVFTKADYKY